MALFDATVFGFSSSELSGFCAAIITPTLGFLFLYSVGIPLKKLPFVETDTEYRPPRWALPIFALGSLACMIGAFTGSILLDNLSSKPSVENLMHEYHREIELFRKNDLRSISGAHLTVGRYDGLSTFQIFINGYRLMSSEVNCMLSYQCQADTNKSEMMIKKISSIQLHDKSLRNIHKSYSIPYTISFLEYLVPGVNIIDVIVTNSGVGDCDFRFDIDVLSNKMLSKSFDIKSEYGPAPEFLAGSVNMHSKGKQPANDGRSRIHPYETLSANSSYRLCERLHLKMFLPNSSLPNEISDQKIWSEWARAKEKRTQCEINNDENCN